MDWGIQLKKKINIETIPAPQMVRVESGTFMMGSTEADIQADRALITEGPQRMVNIPGPFEVGIYEVTEEEFRYFLDSPTRGALSPTLAALIPLVRFGWAGLLITKPIFQQPTLHGTRQEGMPSGYRKKLVRHIDY